jgi:uncharacterized protein (DUF58 family)
MLSPELLKKIAYIEIYTRRLLSSSMAGDSRSAQKGTGLEFNQIREYQIGDDVRYIDWHASARANKLLIKEYIEERNRTIILALDISASMRFSSQEMAKKQVMQQVAAVLAIVAAYGKDRIGLLLFAETVEVLIPPATGRAQMHRILEKIFTHTSIQKGTQFQAVSQQLLALKPKNALVVLISDFIATDIENYLKLIAPAYEIIAIRCLDPIERTVPNLGFLAVHDLESEQTCTLDMRGKKAIAMTKMLEHRASDQLMVFKKYGIDCLDLGNSETFVGDVVRFFRRRMSY